MSVKYGQSVLVSHLGGLSLPRNIVIRLTDHLDMTVAVYSGCKATTQQQQLLYTKHSFLCRNFVLNAHRADLDHMPHPLQS